MRRRPDTLALAFVLASLAVSACASNSSQSVLESTCRAVQPPAMLWPAPGSKNAPDGHLDLYVGYPKPPTPPFTAPTLSAAGHPSVTGTGWLAPSPGPTNPPGILPLPSGDVYWTSGIGALARLTKYSVSVKNTNCNQTYVLGSFTTK
ncbi:MAG TPA: hypothetical protein VGZ02_02430 [Candidatus Baltobacteraceae bacterium]|nr:hypothetical protein [Candidatus Baltobacteraceae bacterium]